MGRLTKLRQWINRDDGRLFRVGNGRLSWIEVAGCLGVIAALVAWQFLRVS